MRRTPSLKTLTLAAALTATVALSGCEAKDDPAPAPAPAPAATMSEVKSAFNALGESDRLALTVSADVSDDVLSHLLSSEGEKPSSEDVRIARALADSAVELKVVYPDGVPLNEQPEDVDPWQTDVQFTVTSGGGELLDVRFVEETLYGAVGVDTLSDIAGEDLASQISPMLSGPLAEPGQALLDGKYLSVTRQVLEQLTDRMDAMSGTPAKDLDPAASKKFADALYQGLEDNGTVSGGEGGYTVVSVQSGPFLDDMVAAIENDKTLAAQLDPTDRAQLRTLRDQAAKVPTVEVEVAITDGTVSEVRLDLTQFASLLDKAKLKFAEEGQMDLVVGFSTDFDITAPASDDVFPADDAATMLLGQF